MKRILLVIGILFVSQSFAVNSTTFCSSPTMANQSGCTSTCAAIADAGSYTLASGSYADCEGVATQLTEYVYKIELGKETIGGESRCTIWEGDDIKIESGSETKGGLYSKYPISLKNCTVGTTYDTIYFTLGRHVDFAGESVFPNDATKMVRTASTYAAKDAGHDDSPVSTWRDNELADSTLNYTAGNSGGGSGSPYKKLGANISATDLTSSSNAVMSWDEVKTSYAWATDSSTRPDFICDPTDSTTCTGEIKSDRYVTIMPASYTDGLPFTMKEGDETLDLEWVKYSSIRGTNESKGVKFLWYNDGGTLKYAGVSVTYDDAYMKLSNIRLEDGL
jgi:hypothetical protein